MAGSVNGDNVATMTIPERLSVDPDDRPPRNRKNSDVSNASDNMTVPDKLLISDLSSHYRKPHLDTPPRVLTVSHVEGGKKPPGTRSAPIPNLNLDQTDDILTLANRILNLQQKVITLESRVNKESGGYSSSLWDYIRIVGISFATAFLVQYLARR